MQRPPVPKNEIERLTALRALNLLDSEPEERFDRLTRMAKRMFEVPIALFTLVDENRQWFKSCFGVDLKETDREISFCGHAINGHDTFIVENTLKDARFHDNPLVEGEPGIRFYAGTPVKTRDGYSIGTLCVMDRVARVFHPEDQAMLEDLARLLEAEIHAVEMATIDDLTGISNRRGFYMVAEHSLSLAHRQKTSATLAIIDLNDFKPINDTHGHLEGDQALKRFAGLLKDFFRDSDLVARIGGDEFAVLMLNTDRGFARSVLDRFSQEVHKLNAAIDKPYGFSYSVGLGVFDPLYPKTIRQLVECADREMYSQKQDSER
ncbi:sensor domain-containing diguanylate cyclase [Reinekea blandensis]|uniref:Diguanylate cyclase, putative n=1 Tax=Reinekea blandensis MED297 TaxID=314283 RepID=A4B9Q6_9GAMM|nr:sensor domain-containing diguanylate cyclase [Reinekea blandensis]EAR11357.1 diguanylate cyclase, putative [Reinekea sp. MED297] [Reinekea blandensis MED297]